MADQPPSPLEWQIFGSILPLFKEMCIHGSLRIFDGSLELAIVYAVEAHRAHGA